MSQTPGYDKTVVDLIIDLIKTSDYGGIFGDNIDYGNPEEGVPFDELPCVLVYKTNTKIEQGPTGMDNIINDILIRLVINKRAFLDQGDWNTAFDQKKIELMVEGNAADTGEYDPASIMGILRTNFTLQGYAVNQGINISYGSVASPFLDERTREAQIRMTVERLQFTPGKQ